MGVNTFFFRYHTASSSVLQSFVCVFISLVEQRDAIKLSKILSLCSLKRVRLYYELVTGIHPSSIGLILQNN